MAVSWVVLLLKITVQTVAMVVQLLDIVRIFPHRPFEGEGWGEGDFKR